MIQIRRLAQQDVEASARLLFESFSVVYRQRGHNPPFPNVDSAAWLCRAYLDLDPDGCAVAESLGQIVGAGFAHLRGAVASIGPVAARPGGPRGIGRRLMEYFRELSAGCESVRLFQDSFNPDSFGFYTRLGYVVVDVAPYLLADRLVPPDEGHPRTVRLASTDDLLEIERYDRARTGASRGRDIGLLASSGVALLAQEGDALAGYLFYRSLPARVIIGPGVAESSEIMTTLIDAVAAALPGRAAVIRGSAATPAVLRRTFERGFRVDHLGNLMVAGDYRTPPAQLFSLFPESL
jgi:ribosomal protein S18 acetylase RimI-like enzyme